MFGSSSSLPPLVSGGGGLVCDSVGKADLLSDHFDSKQCREAVHLSTWTSVLKMHTTRLHNQFARNYLNVILSCKQK